MSDLQLSLFPANVRCYEREHYTAATGEKAENHCGSHYTADGEDYCKQNGTLLGYVGTCAAIRRPQATFAEKLA